MFVGGEGHRRCIFIFKMKTYDYLSSNGSFLYCSCCGNYTLDVIASTTFGMRLDSQTDEENMFVKHGKNVLKYFNLFVMITRT